MSIYQKLLTSCFVLFLYSFKEKIEKASSERKHCRLKSVDERTEENGQAHSKEKLDYSNQKQLTLFDYSKTTIIITTVNRRAFQNAQYLVT